MNSPNIGNARNVIGKDRNYISDLTYGTIYYKFAIINLYEYLQR